MAWQAKYLKLWVTRWTKLLVNFTSMNFIRLHGLNTQTNGNVNLRFISYSIFRPTSVFQNVFCLAKLNVANYINRLGGVVVSVLATGPKGRRFKPGRGDGFLRVIKIRSTFSFGWEVKPKVKCRRFYCMLKIPWGISDTDGQNSHSFVHSSSLSQSSSSSPWHSTLRGRGGIAPTHSQTRH
jgi:hypothetical protein